MLSASQPQVENELVKNALGARSPFCPVGLRPVWQRFREGWGDVTDLCLSSPQRAMCAIFSLICSDLLSQDHIFFITQPKLQQLSEGSPGPVTNKATKVGSAQVSSAYRHKEKEAVRLGMG